MCVCCLLLCTAVWWWLWLCVVGVCAWVFWDVLMFSCVGGPRNSKCNNHNKAINSLTHDSYDNSFYVKYLFFIHRIWNGSYVWRLPPLAHLICLYVCNIDRVRLTAGFAALNLLYMTFVLMRYHLMHDWCAGVLLPSACARLKPCHPRKYPSSGQTSDEQRAGVKSQWQECY